jgi:hypothetical protein
MSKKHYKSSAEFLPFIYEDLDTKNNLIALARSLKDKDGIENSLSSTLIYASLTEYLAQHLLQNLRYLAYRATYLRLNAVVFIDQREKEQVKGLGETIAALSEFEFPDKNEVMSLLKKFNKARNHFFHQFMKINNSNANQFDKDTRIIRECTEDLIDKFNVIYAGLSSQTWEGLTPTSTPDQNDKTSKLKDE